MGTNIACFLLNLEQVLPLCSVRCCSPKTWRRLNCWKMLTLVPASSCFYWIFWICSFQFQKLNTNLFHIQVLLLVAKFDFDLSIPIPTLKVQGHVDYMDVEPYARCAINRATRKIVSSDAGRLAHWHCGLWQGGTGAKNTGVYAGSTR